MHLVLTCFKGLPLFGHVSHAFDHVGWKIGESSPGIPPAVRKKLGQAWNFLEISAKEYQKNPLSQLQPEATNLKGLPLEPLAARLISVSMQFYSITLCGCCAAGGRKDRPVWWIPEPMHRNHHKKWQLLSLNPQESLTKSQANHQTSNATEKHWPLAKPPVTGWARCETTTFYVELHPWEFNKIC